MRELRAKIYTKFGVRFIDIEIFDDSSLKFLSSIIICKWAMTAFVETSCLKMLLPFYNELMRLLCSISIITVDR